MNDDFQFDTLAIRSGHDRTNECEHSEAIFPTSSFVFESAADAAAKFSGDQPGNIYGRMTNPTVGYFQKRLAVLEGGEACVATSSGMSAILAVILALLKAGDHIVCSRSVFGTSTVLLNNYVLKFGVEVDFVDLVDLEQWKNAVKPNTRLFFAETPSNPLTEIVDIRALSDIAHEGGAYLAIDNCFCTPALQKPLSLGADLVIHSATKYLDGHGRCLGGAVVGSEELVGKEVGGILRSGGMVLSPFNAWVFVKGLETLGLRMRAHCESALKLALWLSEHPKVSKVYYPGLKDHPQHELALTQQTGFGGIVSFEVKGVREDCWRVIDSTKMLSITANLGDSKSTITHPASTTHGRLTEEQRAESGIKDNLVRVSVGLESFEDIRDDLARGLA
ncbi:O-succinylhomoserine sulfhydrylase [Leucothrix arctica]|uniref:O-succinylhomoserine sulfhydrylase n=1 Tax=Leucothrix arctica TaxID=1481894 RepID=A0A317CNU4_9GAMM|nr:O-succinylhomoserine sulfhydrylase [Leucothrix arctica]PWQ97992.1 O-succinylhomoserine sulfhydrylase [Leucothrix arctica]